MFRGGGLAQGLGIRLLASGSAYWPFAAAHSDSLWVRTCFDCVHGCTLRVHAGFAACARWGVHLHDFLDRGGGGLLLCYPPSPNGQCLEGTPDDDLSDKGNARHSSANCLPNPCAIRTPSGCIFTCFLCLTQMGGFTSREDSLGAEHHVVAVDTRVRFPVFPFPLPFGFSSLTRHQTYHGSSLQRGMSASWGRGRTLEANAFRREYVYQGAKERQETILFYEETFLSYVQQFGSIYRYTEEDPVPLLEQSATGVPLALC